VVEDADGCAHVLLLASAGQYFVDYFREQSFVDEFVSVFLFGNRSEVFEGGEGHTVVGYQCIVDVFTQ
jgi:hypothetical protein